MTKAIKPSTGRLTLTRCNDDPDDLDSYWLFDATTGRKRLIMTDMIEDHLNLTADEAAQLLADLAVFEALGRLN